LISDGTDLLAGGSSDESANEKKAELKASRRISHILSRARFCAEVIQDGRDKFDQLDHQGELTRLAAYKALEDIAEAAKHIPDMVKDQFPMIPWREISGMRNRLTHEYDLIDDDAVWETMEFDIPELAKQLNLSAQVNCH